MLMNLLNSPKLLRIPICVFLTFLSLVSSAQNPGWFSTGTSYTYVHQELMGPETFETTVEISEQTTLNGQACAKMELVDNELPDLFFCMPKSPPIYLYEQNDSVFFATEQDPEFGLLYNFNAEVGDVWYIVGTHPFGLDSMKVQVLETEMVNVEGNSLKQLTVSIVPADIETQVFEIQSPVRILEFIGTLDFVLIPLGKYVGCDATTSESLQCFISDNLNYASNEFAPCIISSASSGSKLESLTLFPNPANDIVRFRLPATAGSVQSIAVYDVSGKQLIVAAGDLEFLSVSAFKPGMYFFRAQTNKGFIFSGKLAVQH